MKTAILAALVLVCATLNADARPRKVISYEADQNCNILWPCEGVGPTARGLQIERAMPFGKAIQRYTPRVSEVVGGRPAGCPHRFCGCGASLYLFGRIIPSLNLAANWLRFPRAAPASRMVAARRGHVFVLEQHIAGDVWLVHDSNSGGGRTRVHARSIAGFAIVNPFGGSV